MIEIKAEDWIKEGTKRFGKDKKKWKFKCPICGNIQSGEDFIKLGMTKEEAQNRVFFSCIGRWTPNSKGTIFKPSKPCNYTNGGLFNLAKVCVIQPDGSKVSVFEFADAVPLQAKARSIPA